MVTVEYGTNKKDFGMKSFNYPTKEGQEFWYASEARKKIIELLDSVTLESPSFQAFADFTDWLDAKAKLTVQDNIYNNVRLGNIEETVRQRKNGVPGYQWAYEEIVPITVENYRQAVCDREPDHNKALIEFAGELMDIKRAQLDITKKGSSRRQK